MNQKHASCAIPLVFCCFAILAGAAVRAEPLKSGIDRANFDESVKPGQDFFQYVNGVWIKNNPIPAEYSRWGAFPQLRDNNLEYLRQIIEDLTKSAGPLDPDRQKIRDLYLTAMDEAKLRQQGASPLASELESIAKLANCEELVALIAHFHSDGIGAVFSFGVGQDEKQSDKYAVHVRQGGLGLPERGYYLGATDDSKRIRTAYREHVAKMLALLGDSPEAAAAGADVVLGIETKLAEASRTPVQLRDREAQYNKKDLKELAALTPSLNWDRYLKTIDVTDVPYVIVGQPEFFTRLNEMLTSVPLKDWQTYLRWHLVHHAASYLSDDFEKENFRFYSGVMRGVKEMQPRWKRAVGTIDGLMGEALGRLYVEKHFTPDAKRRMDDLVKNILAAYRERIESRDWMGADTKKQALAKLALIMPKIGYPDHWRDYTALEIKTDSYAQNVFRAQVYEVRYRLSKLGKPVDRTEWRMSPPTVNAYYNSSLNEIVFPAGILQPPFFDPAADDAVNYGGIGAVIGHEITHGFDDQGSRSDGQGNMKNWWTQGDRAQFTARTDKLVKQFDACVAIDDLHVNGKLTLGENIADLGGITISYAAYQKSLNGKPAPIIDGFTGPQRFFIGFAQVWRGATREADQRMLLRTDPHSPPNFRTLVPLSNVQAFYDAFNVKPGDAMYRPPEERAEVW
ncbi:MAG: peptidase [Phycisphaerales bacterium]|nr:peptidase [Phycisphaerales bacterium]